MTFQEEYAIVMGKFFRENMENKERLKEMIYWIYNPGADSILSNMTGQEFTAGGCKFRVILIKGEWIIQIRDESNKQVGEIQHGDAFFVYADDVTNRVIALEHNNGIVSDINLFQILLDNY